MVTTFYLYGAFFFLFFLFLFLFLFLVFAFHNLQPKPSEQKKPVVYHFLPLLSFTFFFFFYFDTVCAPAGVCLDHDKLWMGRLVWGKESNQGIERARGGGFSM
ncbi:hypothetical protein L873DRAFT_178481 [Choiromyces venosus 120613-1]|uniref:Uncharacterized protein n=1 Tax=Choiromyces venosus 120613-1 TaxID=1336337 RepID=A0A3N4JZA6_9PEZI|nr:hypothetical protein L873DRAFT_178481 [Choiromyces venosus 120613-1]